MSGAAQPIEGQRALVTGGAGTIGSAVVDQLLAAGAAEVVVLDNFVRGRRENLADASAAAGDRLTVVEGDIDDRALLAELTRGTDLVFHLAALRITQCVALRYFNVYGPRMDAHGKYTEVLIRWMERIADGRPPLIFGDGAQTMDFVHVHDIARANVLAARADVTDRVYNIAGAEETSLKGLALALLSAMDSDLPLEHGPEREVNGVTRRLADISAAARDLGWKPEIGLEDGLRGLVRWWVGLGAEAAEAVR
ncbi:NAD-dependent epimerase/dehydratase family protein [Saccharothrix syringae]|uniref:NAD-dependent epimerase/dehydratase family protein n=1 Tax=Saccharothrix syringae TaxID=103733 RepID=UPI0005271BE0|nr:NAD-dependent epimerase/dehydratase family protein [Saccharothrix syringae]